MKDNRRDKGGVMEDYSLDTPKKCFPVYEEISNLLSSGRFKFVDFFLYSVDEIALSNLMLVALPSLTYAYRDDLPIWEEFVTLCRDELNNRGVDSELELKGLLQ
jgi:hypothetical protein